MKIAIVNLTGGGMSGGYRKYLENILPRLASNREVEAILCASPATVKVREWFNSERLGPAKLLLSEADSPLPKVRFIECRPFSFLNDAPEPELAAELDKFRPDVLFVPPERFLYYPKAPLVVMIMNMAPIAWRSSANPVAERLRCMVQAYAAKKAVRKADHVIAPSEFVKNFLTDGFNISVKKITKIYFGVEDLGKNPSQKPSFLEGIAEKSFFFTAGSIESYRGVEDILGAMIRLKQTDMEHLKLIILGNSRPQMQAYHASLKRFAESNNLQDRVIWVNSLSEEELSWCYENCLAFIMASKIEAGPNIALEALSHGCLCIAADNPPLPEIFAQSALYYPPGDLEKLVKKIREMTAWTDIQKEAFSDSARFRASQFSWDNAAAKTIKLFHEITTKAAVSVKKSSAPMRLAILNLTGGGISGGYKKYLSNIIPRLADKSDIGSIFFIYPDTLNMESWLPAGDKIEFHKCRPFNFMSHELEPDLKKRLDAFGPDLLFIPLERCVRYDESVPVVSMIQNMAPLAGVRAAYGIFERAKSMAQYVEAKMSALKSTRIIAVSDFVKGFLLENWMIPREKISLIHYGSGSLAAGHMRPAVSGDIKPGEFMFTAGSIEPYRGLEDIIEAMVKLKERGHVSRLVIAGQARQGLQKYFSGLRKMASNLGVDTEIYWMGELSEKELAWCYSNCSMFIMSSRVESFGMVSLEAMSYGCNCISSSNPCMPEIFGNAAVYYRAGDSKGLADAITSVSQRDIKSREEFSIMARRRASEFSWDVTADKTTELFKEVIKEVQG